MEECGAWSLITWGDGQKATCADAAGTAAGGAGEAGTQDSEGQHRPADLRPLLAGRRLWVCKAR